jgi:hypothetical protein
VELFKHYYLLEGVGTYKLPNGGEHKFGDFYMMELIASRLGNEHTSEHIGDKIVDLRDNMVLQLAHKMYRYLKTACLDELHNIDNSEAVYGPMSDDWVGDDWDDESEVDDEEAYWHDRVGKYYGLEVMKKLDNFIGEWDDAKSAAMKLNIDQIIMSSEDVDLLTIDQKYLKWWDDIGPRMIYDLLMDDEPGDTPGLDGGVIMWSDGYAKDSWAQAVTATLKLGKLLEKGTVDYNLVKHIDNIYDMQHNSGVILNKSKQLDVPRNLLDFRAQASATDLINNLETSLEIKKIVQRFEGMLTKHEGGESEKQDQITELYRKLVELYIKENEIYLSEYGHGAEAMISRNKKGMKDAKLQQSIVKQEIGDLGGVIPSFYHDPGSHSSSKISEFAMKLDIPHKIIKPGHGQRGGRWGSQPRIVSPDFEPAIDTEAPHGRDAMGMPFKSDFASDKYKDDDDDEEDVWL